MDITITKEKPEFNNFAEELKKQGLSKEEIDKRLIDMIFVQFPNCISSVTKKSFKWMPTYEQLEKIKVALDEVEKEKWDKLGCGRDPMQTRL